MKKIHYVEGTNSRQNREHNDRLVGPIMPNLNSSQYQGKSSPR